MANDFDPTTYKITPNLTLRDYQLKNLELFKYFDHFCREHNITYYLNGGALIGAVRHGGFIPWDCDVDIFLMRKDYERIGKLWNKYADTDHYAFDRTDHKHNMHDPGEAIKDNYTTYIRKHNINEDINHGIQIDLIALDYLSDNWFYLQWQRFNGLVFCLFNTQRLPNQQGKIARIGTRIILGIFRSKEVRYKIWKAAEKVVRSCDGSKSKYLGELTIGLYQTKLKYKKEWFAKPIEIPFEDMMVEAPTEIEKYLSMRYGDYMSLPPKDEQIPKMDPAFVDINTPYIKYKGIKYCKKNNKE